MQRPLDDAIEERLAELEASGLRRTLLSLSSAGPGRVALGGRTYLDFGSNDYLGLSQEPLDWEGLAQLATGARASRLVSGNLAPHLEAERLLAEHVGLPAALLFTSGYATNVGALPALVGPGDHIFSDVLNHASLIDGCRLSRAEVHVFAHNDLGDLEARLEDAPPSGHRLIVTEAVFSMEGDRAPLPALARLAESHGAWLMVDEAHSLGILGPEGRGLCRALGVVPDVLVGTLGKAFGAQGAFIAGSAKLRELLFHRARSLVFSTGISPVLAGIVARRTPQVQSADDARSRQLTLCERLASGLRAKDIEVRGSGPVVTAVFGDPRAASVQEGLLREAGIIARAIRPPTVPEGTSRIRFVPTAAHEAAHIDRILEVVGKRR